MNSVRLDPEYGVNPSLSTCFFCQEDNEIILFGALTPKQRKALGSKDGQAPHRICVSKQPCPKCLEHMKQGIILISVDEAKSKDTTNPYRTGGWCVVKEEAIKRIGIKPQELEDAILTKRIAFIPDDAWDMLGLPSRTTPSVV